MAENMKKNVPENMPPMPDKPKKRKKASLRQTNSAI